MIRKNKLGLRILAGGWLWLCVGLAGQAMAQNPPQGGYDCLLEPSRDVELGFPVAGIVSEVLFDRGDFVLEGDILARLQSDAEQVAIELARAKLDFSWRKVERTRELLRDDFVSDFNVDEAVTELRLAELELRRAEVNLALRSLVSPTTGIVVDRSLSIGEFASAEDVIRVVEIDPLHVEVVMPVRQFGSIREGMQARIVPEEPVGREYLARVTTVDQVVDAASGTFGVRLELPNGNRRIPAGLKCRVEF